MSTLLPTRQAHQLRYGHLVGDLLTLELRNGHRFSQTDAAGTRVEEKETKFVIAQTTLGVSENYVVVENIPLSASLRQGEQEGPLDFSPQRQQLRLLRNGARADEGTVEPLAIFVFPEHPLSCGDSWEASLTLNIVDGDPFKASLRCTVSDLDAEGNVRVAMVSPEISVTSEGRTIQVGVSGRIEFSTAQGTMVHGSLETMQRCQDDQGESEWIQWLVIQMTDRIGGDEFSIDE